MTFPTEGWQVECDTHFSLGQLSSVHANTLSALSKCCIGAPVDLHRLSPHKAPRSARSEPLLLSAKESFSRWHTTMRRNTTFVANKDKRYLRVCHCNQANEALKKPYMWPSITNCTKEMQFIRLCCGGFCPSVIWVQLSVILQQWMLSMPQLRDGLRGKLLPPAGWEIHSYPDYAKICWEKLNTSHSSCHPFTSLFVFYSYALYVRPCPSGTSASISCTFLLCLW